ncbi:MAG: TIGR00159 family protein [Ruminococcaceae bacterium]|nr:TIGR00159 family protein [Oscillospiraceae bacterium]
MNDIALWFEQFREKYIMGPLARFSLPGDLLDLIFLTALFYWIYTFIKNRRAGKLAIGVGLVFVAYGVSDIFDMQSFHMIISAIMSAGVVLVVIIFQPELRDVLEKIGSTPFGFRVLGEKEQAEVTNTINAVVEAAIEIAQTDSDGALIVIEGTTKLGEYVDKGHRLDAQVSTPLLKNIFVNRSPLHDGAVIISDNRIAAAGCKLPLTNNEEGISHLGTRHRAAVGITEYCNDCVVVVVSEERHRISIANSGFIRLDYNKNVADLKAEESVKVIRNALRQDLFHLLTNINADEAIRIAERKAEKERKKAQKRDIRRQLQADQQLKRRAPRSVKSDEDQPANTAK